METQLPLGLQFGIGNSFASGAVAAAMLAVLMWVPAKLLRAECSSTQPEADPSSLVADIMCL